jgi:serine/threonine-protein kinase RsbT
MAEGRNSIIIASEVSVAAATRYAMNYAKTMAFKEKDRHLLATVVSELANNIIKYAGRGEIFFEEEIRGEQHGIRVLAKDKGPGIANPKLAMEEHYSTQGTLGLGLSGIKRMVDEFGIYTSSGEGVKIVVIKWRQ